VVYVVGARYTGPKGITNFPGDVSIGNLAVNNTLTIHGTVFNGSDITTSGNISAVNVFQDRGADMNDWNTVTTMGVYLINRTSWSGTTNTPLNTMIYTGQLEVVNTGNISITQNYRPYSNTPGQDVYWTRGKYGTNSWTPWVEIINGAETMDGGSF
jgi:hypothetical protein